MKLRLVVALVVSAIGIAAPTFAQQKDTVDPQIAQQIRALAVKFDAAFNNHDAAAVAALYTEDGVNVFRGTSHGRQAVEKSYAHDFQSWHPNSRVTKVDRVIAVGNEVRLRGSWSQSLNDYGPTANHGLLFMDYSPPGQYLEDPQRYRQRIFWKQLSFLFTFWRAIPVTP
jgi:ketosteroid isomerase-like protein